MPDYRLFHFDGGHIWSAEVISAVNDASAVAQAGKIADGRHAELWRGAAMLRAFNKPGTETGP